MPNGFHGNKREWERITAPLKMLDRDLKRFAKEHRLRLLRDTRNWPERSFRWHDALDRLIQIYLVDESRLTWSLWICAVEDRSDGRYWKRAFIKEDVPAKEIAEHLPDLLHEAYALVTSWTAEDLQKA